MSYSLCPLTLSLSKGCPRPQSEGQGFDKLSLSGFTVQHG